MNDPRGRQVGFNAESRGQWENFADHRGKVSALLGAAAAPGPTRLCVLGAGNGNDLDLPALLAAHREVHLVDLDPAALDLAAARQGVAGRPGLRLFGGVDVTGMVEAFAAWSPRTTVHPAELSALADWPPGRVAMALPGPFDLVASTCLLTQLIGNARHSLGDGHPQSGAVVRAIRAGHLRLLTRLAARGGGAVLVTDLVSSDTLPGLASLPEAALADLPRRLDRLGNFIRGVGPADLVSAFRRDPFLAEQASGLEATPPWRWRLHDRVYLVWALRWRGRAEAG